MKNRKSLTGYGLQTITNDTLIACGFNIKSDKQATQDRLNLASQLKAMREQKEQGICSRCDEDTTVDQNDVCSNCEPRDA